MVVFYAQLLLIIFITLKNQNWYFIIDLDILKLS